jgi:hypothetical protein
MSLSTDVGPRLSREAHRVERGFEAGDKSCPRNKTREAPLARGFSFAQIALELEWYHGDTISLMAMTVRFTAEQEAQLTQLSEIWGVSKQQALINAVEKMLADLDYETKKREGLAFVTSEYADLIKRLGE